MGDVENRLLVIVSEKAVVCFIRQHSDMFKVGWNLQLWLYCRFTAECDSGRVLKMVVIRQSDGNSLVATFRLTYDSSVMV